jgi:hypothetical protein
MSKIGREIISAIKEAKIKGLIDLTPKRSLKVFQKQCMNQRKIYMK